MEKILNKKILVFSIIVIVAFLLEGIHTSFGQKMGNWSILVNKTLQKDEAIRLVIDDLQKSGKVLNLTFNVANDNGNIKENSILIGNASQNRKIAELLSQGKIRLEGIRNPQGYEIITKNIDGNRVVIVSGGSVLGDVYGLYWIWDRMRVFKAIPEINTKRVPRLENRLALNSGNRSLEESKEIFKNALRFGQNWVAIENPLRLVPWDSEPENAENKIFRQRTRKAIQYAHALHLKYFVYGDEFTYHPSLLKEFNAKLSPCDSSFWLAVQGKYRRLLRAMPEIDGVAIRIGELTGIWGNYKAFDVIHGNADCGWTLEKRYRTFVKKIYDVVVGEFGKLYYQRTWSTSSFDQHSNPEIFKKIFTDDIPIDKLYIAPKITRTDRWWFQPYNRTFNLTPHHTVAEFEPMTYHEAGQSLFPSYPGEYFQDGIQTILSADNSNLRGYRFNCPSPDGWSSYQSTAYALFRLGWNPFENIETITRDFAAIHFGPKAAKIMAEIYMLSARAYKYGIYIEPVAYGQFSSLLHLRNNNFLAKGFPLLDNGRGHIQFLHSIYLRCEPWMTETIMYLDHGLEIAKEMKEKYQLAKHLIKNKTLAAELDNSLQLTYLLIKTNNLYVKTFFSYFDYRKNPTQKNKQKLFNLKTQLQNSMIKFSSAPDFSYKLTGMEVLLINVNRALENLKKAEQLLSHSPNNEQIKQRVRDYQKTSNRILHKYKSEAVKFLHWEGRVDGQDLIKIAGDKMRVEHLRYDRITDMNYKQIKSLPKKNVTVIPVDIQSRSFHPFVLEQPDDKNNYTVTIYLSDFPMPSRSLWKFDLYYIPKRPQELGLPVHIGDMH